MKILRVLNNNVVLARPEPGDPVGTDAQEVILTGRGIGFRAHAGQDVDLATVVRIFAPTDGRDPDHLAEALAMIDQEVIRAVVIALTETGLEDRESTRPTLSIAIADHIAGAMERERHGQRVEYPLTAEVSALYPEEFARAQALLAAVNQRVSPALPASEATAIALHLVNDGFASGDLAFTYTMTGVIQQMLAVISEQFGIDLSRDSISGARFITHVRYLFVRVHQHRQLTETDSLIGEAIRTSYPEATRTARRLATIVQLRLGAELTEDEISYLALHVARMTMDRGAVPAQPTGRA